MTRFPLYRLMIATLALLAGLAGPASAVVHGYQHGRPYEANHHVQHRHDDDQHGAPADHHSDEQGERNEHDHPRLDAGRTQPHAPLTAAVMPVEVFLLLPAVEVTVQIQPSVARRVPPERQTGPPSRPRAPPIR